jgi:hypothetical protein
MGTWKKVRQSTRMTPIDFEKARAAHVALKEFFAAHPEGRLDRAAFDNLRALCRAAERAVPDVECRRAIRSIEVYSALLSPGDTLPPRGADFVRLRVENALASFRSQLEATQAVEALTLS